MIKISDWAVQNGISDRHARRLMKQYEVDIDGHVEKRGGAGTWIDDYAADLLKSKLRVQFEVLPSVELNEKTAELYEKLSLALAKSTELAEKLADAERRLGENSEATAKLEAEQKKVLLLEEHTRSVEKENIELKVKVAVAEEKSKIAFEREIEKELALTKAKEENEKLADIAEMNGQAANEEKKAKEAAEAEAAELRRELEKLKNRNIFQRIFNRE